MSFLYLVMNFLRVLTENRSFRVMKKESIVENSGIQTNFVCHPHRLGFDPFTLSPLYCLSGFGQEFMINYRQVLFLCLVCLM